MPQFNTNQTRYTTWIFLILFLVSLYYTLMSVIHIETDHYDQHSRLSWERSSDTIKLDIQKEEQKQRPDIGEKYKPPTPKRYAWASLAMKDYDVKGVVALAQSLRWANSTYPFVVVAAKTLSDKMIHLLKLPNLKIERIVFIDPIEIPEHIHMGWDHWRLALNKLEMWNFDEYAKLVYIDADFIVLKNIDDFFDYPELTASTNLGVPCRLEATPDHNQGGVNAGLVVLEPSRQKYKDMIKMFNNGTNWHNSDQGIIEAYFSQKTRLLPINWVTFSWCCNAPWFDRKVLRAVHFTRGTINYDKLALQDINADWDKNWPGKPNCDLDFYVHWKKMWHMAVE